MSGRSLISKAVYFTGKSSVMVNEEQVSQPGPYGILVKSQFSAISSGSELLVYRGQVPVGLPVDESITSLGGQFNFPLKYGYSLVGEVIAVGEQVGAHWIGRRVFAFNPHEELFVSHPENVLPIPDRIEAEQAIFLPNMESAVNFLMDGRPLIGERVLVLGQGIVGLLTTALLAQYPVETLITVDHHRIRREASLALGAHASLDPADPDIIAQLRSRFDSNNQHGGPDLIYELSGSPAGLDLGIQLAPFHGRIIIGSWYGTRSIQPDLGGRFHRDRVHLVSSQVSTLAPEFTGRWTKSRRLETAWKQIELVQPARLITHRIPVTSAAEAYRLLDLSPEKAIQIILTYSSNAHS